MTRSTYRGADAGLPTLAAVLDRKALRRHLRGIVDAEPSEKIDVRILRWKKADRCTLEIAFESPGKWHAPLTARLLGPRGAGGGRREFIGKVYAEDRADVHRTMQEIGDAGFAPDTEFAVPRTVAYLSPLRLVLYEKAPGTRARKLIARGGESDATAAAERCARWLARFHARGPLSGTVVDLADHVLSSERAWRAISDLGPPFAEKAERLFAHLGTAARTTRESRMCAAHGTYTPGQVLVSKESTVTIDWDTYQVTDPSNDVARFLVELARMGLKYFGSTSAYDHAARAFLRTYVAEAGADVTRRLAFHQGAIYLDRAKHDIDKPRDGSHEKAETMLDEGLRALAEGRWATA